MAAARPFSDRRLAQAEDRRMVKFSSKATGSFEMLDGHAEQVLAVIGKQVGERGIITREQIPGAIAALKAASARAGESARRARPPDDDEEEPVSLGQRAFPLLDMLERAQAADEPVLWGV